MYLHDVSCSFSTFMPVPIVCAFLARYKTGPTKHERRIQYEDPSNPFKIEGSGKYLNAVVNNDAYTMLQERYGIDHAQIADVESMILDSSPLTFLSHPVFVALWMQDYA